jgi:hypothetical protein
MLLISPGPQHKQRYGVEAKHRVPNQGSLLQSYKSSLKVAIPLVSQHRFLGFQETKLF